MKKTNAFSVKHLVLDAVLVALYVVLGFVKIPIGNMPVSYTHLTLPTKA